MTKKSVVVPPTTCIEACGGCSYECERKLDAPVSIEEALDTWLSPIDLPQDVETVPLSSACGRVLAEETCSKFDVPLRSCAMHDGIAVNYQVCCERLSEGGSLSSHEFLHAPLGTVIPEPFDTVVHAEECAILTDGSALVFKKPVRFQSVTVQGSYVEEGERIVPAGNILTPSDLLMLQYAGFVSVQVVRRPLIGIIPVGDDLVAPGRMPEPGQSIECDSIYLQTMAAQCGADTRVSAIVPDDEEAILHAIEEEIPRCDALVLIGGVGKGESRYGDHTVSVIRERGIIRCYGVKVGPGGKNLVLAQVDGKPVCGMPGPPHAAIVITEYFIPPLVERYYGCPCFERQTVEVRLENDMATRGGDGVWLPRMHVTKEQGGYRAHVVKYMGETVENFIDADAYVAVTGDPSRFKEGGRVTALLLRGVRSLPQDPS